MSRHLVVLSAVALAVSACSKEEAPPVAATKAKPSVTASTQAKARDYEIKLLVAAQVGDRRELQLTAYRISKTETKNKGMTVASKGDRDEFLFTGSIKTLA